MKFPVKIFGFGEVGKSLHQVYQEAGWEKLAWKDIDNQEGPEECTLLNVCIPYSEDFINTVVAEVQLSNPSWVVIHSTVKPGTTREIAKLFSGTGRNFFHSPVIGIHPNLTESLKTFVKWIGGIVNCSEDHFIYKHFQKIGLPVFFCYPAEITEIMKLWDTTYYGMCLALNAEVERMLKQYQLPYELWVDYLQEYNMGYQELGMYNVTRPYFEILQMPIGGHCIGPNVEILKKVNDSMVLTWLKGWLK